MVLQDSVEASSDMRDAGDVCLDEVWEDGMGGSIEPPG